MGQAKVICDGSPHPDCEGNLGCSCHANCSHAGGRGIHSSVLAIGHPRAAIRLMLDKDAAGGIHMYACRGLGKGCKRNNYRDPKSQKICADCVPTRDEETLGELQERLARMDA